MERDTIPWYADHTNLALTADYMHDRGDAWSDIRRMLEKPWDYADEFRMAERSMQRQINLDRMRY